MASGEQPTETPCPRAPMRPVEFVADCPACERPSHIDPSEWEQVTSGAFFTYGPGRWPVCEYCKTQFEVMAVRVVPVGENSPTWDGRPPNPERSGEICGLCHGEGETDSVVSHEPASGDTQAALCVTGETQHQSTIRAALRAATEEVCRYGDGLRCDPEPDCDFCRQHAAKVVAAFVRAAPIKAVSIDCGGRSISSHGAHAREELARMVEEAANAG